MKAKDKVVSRTLATLLVVVLCAASYMLGARRSSEQRSDNIHVQGAGSENGTVAASPSLPDSSSPADSEIIPAADDGLSVGDKQNEIAAGERERMMRNIADNLAMPGMNEMIQQQQRVLMADKYRSFIKSLGLSPKEEEYLLDLLTARQMLQVDFGMKLMTGMLSEAERLELMENLGSGMEEWGEEIDWFLNSSDDSDYFKYYDKTEGERTAVASVANAASLAGYPFDDGVEEQLVALMYDELSSYPFSVNLEENGEPVFENYTDVNISTFMQELEQLRDPVFQQAASMLDPEQLEIFEQYYAQYLAFYEQRLRMAQQFFNSDQ